jgi:hypothetical protein
MSYKTSILFQPTRGKYPFLLATEADGIPLTRKEVEALRFECEVALMEADNHDKERIGNGKS